MIEANMGGFGFPYVTDWFLSPYANPYGLNTRRKRTYLRVVTPPKLSAEPLTLDQAKAHLRVGKPGVTHPDDAHIQRMLSASRRAVENYCNRIIAVSTFEAKADYFDADLMAPAVVINSVSYLSAEPVPTQTVLPIGATWEIGANPMKPSIRLRPGQSWPSVYTREDSVIINFDAGQAPEDVEPALAHAILMTLGDMHDHRESTVAVMSITPWELPLGVRFLMNPYRLGMGV